MLQNDLEYNLQEVEEKIISACKRSGRKREEVTLIAVSKTKPIEMLQSIYNCNIRHFGENKVQELVSKEEALEKDINWHMIGHLQKNKVKYIAKFVSCIHSVDSLSLASIIQKEGEKADRIIDVLIEINVAEEESKFGIKLCEAEDFIREIAKFSHINVRGLMTIAPFVPNSEENRIHFIKLRELLVDINDKNIDNINMSVLSMGMSNDYEVAIEEGATHVRVGTSIFGERNYNL
ncbi:MAG: YggS family pyridoxal phosphate-dependent enzyme [Eubacteriales bacterium]